MTGKVASMRDAIADLVRDGDTVAIEGFTHLIGFSAGHEIIRQRKRDLTLARMTPDLDLRPDDRRRRRPQADLLAGSATRASGASTPSAAASSRPRSAATDAARDRGVQPLRHGRPVHGGRRQPPVHAPALLLRDGPAEGEPADPRDPLALLGRDGLCRAAAQPGRHGHPRPARGRERQHPDLGPPRLPEGGRLRRRSRHRRGGGAGGRGGDPRGPEPDGDPGPDRGCRGGGPVRRPPLVRPGRLRPRQPLLPRLGPHQPRRGRRSRPGSATGSTTCRTAPPTCRSWARSAWRPSSPAPRRPAPSTTGTTDERPRLLQERDDDRRRRAGARRPAGLLRRRRAAEHRREPRQADGRAGHGAGLRGRRLRGSARRGCRCRSGTRRS